jgi:hypothetical protein
VADNIFNFFRTGFGWVDFKFAIFHFENIRQRFNAHSSMTTGIWIPGNLHGAPPWWLSGD